MTTLNKTRLPGQEQVWLYFICGTTRPGYMGTTMNLQIILNTQKNPYLNQATQKNTCQIFIPKKIPESKISNPKKSFDHPRHLKSGVPPLGSTCRFSSLFSTYFLGTSWENVNPIFFKDLLRTFARKRSTTQIFVIVWLQSDNELPMSEMQKHWGVTDFVFEIKSVETHPNFDTSVLVTRHGLSAC